MPTWLPPVAVVVVSSVAMYVGILVYDVDASEAAEAGGLFDWDPAMLATARGWAPLLDIDALGGPIQVENVDDDAEVGAAVTEAPFCVVLVSCLIGSGGECSLKHLSHRAVGGVATFFTPVRWAVVFQCRGVILAAATLGSIKIGLKTGAFPALFPNEAICADAEVAMVGAQGKLERLRSYVVLRARERRLQGVQHGHVQRLGQLTAERHAPRCGRCRCPKAAGPGRPESAGPGRSPEAAGSPEAERRHSRARCDRLSRARSRTSLVGGKSAELGGELGWTAAQTRERRWRAQLRATTGTGPERRKRRKRAR